MKSEKLFKTPLTESQARNSELNHIECVEAKTVLESYPRRIVYELTNRCNFNCIMCGREAVNFKTNDLPVALIKAFSPAYEFCEEITLHGWGEGTLHPRLPEVIEYLNAFPLLRKYFVTNGSTLPRIMELVFRHRVDLIAVSLDGVTPETNNSIRKGGNIRREIESVRRLLEEKAARALDYPYVNFVFTAMKRNIHELSEMVTLAHELGVPEVKAVYLTVFEESLRGESLVDSQQTVREYFNEARSRAGRLGIRIKLPEIQGEGEAGTSAHKQCSFPWRDLYVGSDGFVRPCQSASEKILNARDFKTIEEVWNSSEMRSLRSRVNNEALMSKSCLNCYHSTCANWNKRESFIQCGKSFAPEWVPKEAAAAKGLSGSAPPPQAE